MKYRNSDLLLRTPVRVFALRPRGRAQCDFLLARRGRRSLFLPNETECLAEPVRHSAQLDFVRIVLVGQARLGTRLRPLQTPRTRSSRVGIT
jgi:hypothetical protein